MLNKTLITIRSFVVAVGATAASSFVGVYGVFLGASAAMMGWLQSSSNAISNGGQLLWGNLSDRLGARRPFLVAGSGILAVLWFFLARVQTPLELILVYAAIALFSSMITVNWFSLIADITDTSVRGRFLAVINILSSIGTIISLIAMTFFFSGSVSEQITIPFIAATGSYVISGILIGSVKEQRKRAKITGNLRSTLRKMKEHPLFRRYFIATNVQGIFWSMAWPMFPITMVTVMGFTLSQVAYLTVASMAVTVFTQFVLGRFTDRVNRVPLIFLNRAMLALIPLMYGFFTNFNEFIIMEVYSGISGSLQNVVLNSYLLDVIPSDRKAQYIALINGFNGIVYMAGALTGGYLLEYLLTLFHVRLALIIGYSVAAAGRFASSLIFLRLEEPEKKGRAPLHLYNILNRQKQPGHPSGGVLRIR